MSVCADACRVSDYDYDCDGSHAFHVPRSIKINISDTLGYRDYLFLSNCPPPVNAAIMHEVYKRGLVRLWRLQRQRTPVSQTTIVVNPDLGDARGGFSRRCGCAFQVCIENMHTHMRKAQGEETQQYICVHLYTHSCAHSHSLTIIALPFTRTDRERTGLSARHRSPRLPS